MQGCDSVHCLPSGRLVTPSGSVNWLQGEADNRSHSRTARRAKNLSRQVQRRFAAGRRAMEQALQTK